MLETLSILIHADSKVGKAQPLSSRVMTPDGWRTIGDIAVGDYVYGVNGRPTRVLGVYPQGVRDVYKVRLADGGETRSSADHLWSVEKQRRVELTTTTALRNYLATESGQHFAFTPFLAPLDRPHVTDLPLDPYTLGLLLGNGSFVGATPAFSSADGLIEALVLPLGAVANRYFGHGHDNQVRIKGIYNQIRELGLSGLRSVEKFIPSCYMHSSIQQRMELLRGLLDTDGHAEPIGSLATYATSSPRLARDMRELVWSLGGVITEVRHSVHDGCTGSIRLPDELGCPFRLERKASVWQAGRDSRKTYRRLTRRYVAVEEDGAEECVCLHVEAADGLYVTDDYIVTHNTTLAATSPPPILILDAEGGSKFLPIRKVMWDPRSSAPPAADGTWDACVVIVRDFDTIRQAYQWLQSGQHGFRSLVIDSITEVQRRAKSNIAGAETMEGYKKWGDLLTLMDVLIRGFRDLTLHPTNPVQVVVFIAETRLSQSGKWRPYMQGQIDIALPYWVDVIGYLFVDHALDVNGQPTQEVRRLLVSPNDKFEAGERVQGRLRGEIEHPNVSAMLLAVYPHLAGAGTAPAQAPPPTAATNGAAAPRAVPGYPPPTEADLENPEYRAWFEVNAV